MFENEEMQGYLPKTGSMWLIAGAHDRAFFERNCAAVMACFNSRHTGDDQEVIFYPPLLDLIAAQRTKLRGTKRAREGLSSTSQSEFDFKKEKERPKTEVCEKPYQQADFDARDLRLMKIAQDKFDRKCQPGAHLPDWMRDEKQVFEWICQEAGITVQRGLELEALQRKWPESEGRANAKKKNTTAAHG
jgi:hypothetical protein